MKIINQLDYPKLYLGDEKTSVASAGCYSCCLAMIAEITIEECLVKLKKGNAFSGALLKHPQDALALGFETYECVYSDPQSLCIAEVDFNPDPDKDQHFVVWLGDGNIIDPWGGVEKKNNYKVYSYRIYKPLKKTMTEEQEKNFRKIAKEVSDFVDVDFGENPNSKETADIVSRMNEKKKELSDVSSNLKNALEVKQEALGTIETQRETINDLEEQLKQIGGISEEYITKIENQSEMLNAKDEQIKKLKEQGGEMTIMSHLKGIINLILKS
jgi:hypothetical protein